MYTYCANDIINDLYSLSFLTCDVYMFVHACCILYILCLTFRSSGQEKDFYIPDGDYLAGILYYMYRCIYVYLLTCYMKTCVTLFI